MTCSGLFSLEGTIAPLVGGGGAIGGAMAQGLVCQGAQVGTADLSAEALRNTADRIKQETGEDVSCFQADIADEQSVRRLCDDFCGQLGGIDILVNSQGLNKKSPACDRPMDEWDKMFAVNVRSIMLTCKYFGKVMIERGGGRVINVSSIGAVRTKADDSSVCYGATKGAVNTLTLTLAAGWAKHNVTVNAIALIMTETSMMKAIFEKNSDLRDGTAARVPMGRIGVPEDTVGPMLFFASAAAAFVTGQTIYPDGGLMTLQ